MTKVKKIVVKKPVENPVPEVVKENLVAPSKPLIGEFTTKLGREDLDKLVDKLNEVIRYINA